MSLFPEIFLKFNKIPKTFELMTKLLHNNKGRGLTLPASIRRKYSLKPGSRLELEDKNGEILLVPLCGGENLFELIDKKTKPVSDKELAELKKKVRTHAIVH